MSNGSEQKKAIIKLPSLDLSLLERSERLVKDAHLSAKESARSRRSIPLSSRTFSTLKLTDVDESNRINVQSSSSDRKYRKYRIPLSNRLPPQMTESLNEKAINTYPCMRSARAYNKERRRSLIVDNSKENHDFILSLLDCRRMEELKNEFQSKNHELQFEEFVHVVWKFMNVQKGKETFAICALLQLFEDIDINDDGKMQWSEFSDFLAASQRHSNDSDIDLAKYEICNFKKPFSLRGSSIQQLQYSLYYDVIAILMANSKQITIFNHENNQIVNTIKGHTNYIISCIFLDGFNGIPLQPINKTSDKNMQIIIASSGLDETIIIWLITSTKKRPTRLQTISVNCVHNILYWSGKKFISGDMNHNLYIWNRKITEIIWKKNYHSDMIIDIIVTQKTSLLLSASLDTSVVAFDLNNDRIKFKLNIHKRGLIAMAYKPAPLHCIVTAAAEHNLRVSDGIVGRPLAVLQGHSSPLVSMISITDSPSIVSLDCQNTFKVWDLRKMECIQSIHLTNNICSMLSLLPNHNKIAVGSAQSGGIHYLSQKKQASQQLMDGQTENVCGIFSIGKSQILTVHETMIKKWDLNCGEMLKLIRILQGPPGHAIISCTVSETKKLLLLGSSNGLVAIVSIYSGGLVMTCQPKHANSVIFVGFYKTMIISLDCNGSIFKYEGFKYFIEKKKQSTKNCISRDALSRSKLVQIISNKCCLPYTVACIDKQFGILIVGCDDGLLRFFELQRDKIILDVKTSNDSITSIVRSSQMKDYKLFTSDKSGNICCWLLPNEYSSNKHFFCKCLYRIKNYDNIKKIEISTFCVKICGNYIISGDAKGLIKIWSLRPMQNENENAIFNLTQPNKKYECKLVNTICAATDWINNVHIVTDENNISCIISASFDGKLFAWKLNGECVGELIYLKKPKIRWKLQIDINKKRNKQLKYAYQLFKRMQL